MDLSLHFEDRPGEALEGYDTWTPKGTAPFNGATLALFEGVTQTACEKSKVLLFVDPSTECPVKAEYVIPIHSTFGSRPVAATVLFRATPEGKWIPSSATIDEKGRWMFWRRHLVIRKSYEDWVKKP